MHYALQEKIVKISSFYMRSSNIHINRLFFMQLFIAEFVARFLINVSLLLLLLCSISNIHFIIELEIDFFRDLWLILGSLVKFEKKFEFQSENI